MEAIIFYAKIKILAQIPLHAKFFQNPHLQMLLIAKQQIKQSPHPLLKTTLHSPFANPKSRADHCAKGVGFVGSFVPSIELTMELSHFAFIWSTLDPTDFKYNKTISDWSKFFIFLKKSIKHFGVWSSPSRAHAFSVFNYREN